MVEETIPNNELSATMTRRDFLGTSWRVLAAFLAGQGACMGMRFLASRKAEGDFGALVTAGLASDFPLGTITPFDADKFFLVRFEDGGFLALYTKCTHLACTVAWEEAKGRFVCPCHGSEFDQHGGVINPPAPQPLDRFAIEIDSEGRVIVDTRTTITRTTTNGDPLIYAPVSPPTTPETPETRVGPGRYEVQP